MDFPYWQRYTLLYEQGSSWSYFKLKRITCEHIHEIFCVPCLHVVISSSPQWLPSLEWGTLHCFMWLEPAPSIRCPVCAWIIRNVCANSNCVSFIRCWPVSSSLLPGAIRSGMLKTLLNMATGTIRVIALALEWAPHHPCINYYGQDEYGFFKKKKGKEGKIKGSKRLSEDETSTVAVNWTEIYCQPKCGREALKIQSFSNVAITLER